MKERHPGLVVRKLMPAEKAERSDSSCLAQTEFGNLAWSTIKSCLVWGLNFSERVQMLHSSQLVGL